MAQAIPNPSQITYSASVGEEPSHAGCLWLLDYWAARAGAAKRPAYADIDLLDIPERLPCLFVAEPLADATDYHIRFSGTTIEARLGLAIQGRRVSEIYPAEMAQDFIGFYRQVTVEGQRVVLNGRFIGLDIDHVHYEAILLPIDGLTAETWLLGGLFAFNLDC